ncbi:MAG: hypothetical protein JEY99_19670 [Spirochaetales bacterium]|nr:hypothetical protein [Spirochaetales bacterium]
MIGLLVEIIGLQQLIKLEPSYVSGLNEKILNLLNLPKDRSYNSGNCFYLQFEYIEEDGRKTWESVNEVYEYLLAESEEFQGFLILIDRVKNSTLEDGFAMIRKKSYSLREYNALVITPRAEDYCAGFFKVDHRGENLVVSSKSKWKPLDTDHYDSFYHRDRLVDRIAGRLIPFIDDEEEPSILHFYGNPGIGKNFNIKKSILKIREKSPYMPLPIINGTEGLKAAFQEIIESLDANFLKTLPEKLLSPEKISWESRKFLLEEGASDHGPHDILLFYRLYVQAYLRLAEENLHPAYIICRDPEFLNEESLTLLTTIIQEFLFPGGLVPVIISETKNLPGTLSSFSCQRIRVTPLSLMEVEERLSKAGLEGGNTYDIREKTEGHVLFLSHYIILNQKSEEVPEGISGKDISIQLLRQLDLRLQATLYAICLFPGMTDADHWARILEENRIVHHGAKSVLKELENFGYLSEDQWLRPVIPNVEEGVSLSPADKVEIEMKIARTGSSIWSEQKMFSVYSFLQGLKSRDAVVNFSRYFFDYTSQLLEQGQTGKGEALIEVFENLKAGEVNDSLNDTVIHTLGLRSALMQGDQEVARIRFLALTDIAESPLTLAEALNNLEAARYLYASGEYREALDAAKKALLFMQDEDNRLLNSDANCQIGLIMIGMERLDEAAMYFTLGREQLNPEENPHNYIKAMVMEGLCQFIIGNLSQVRRILEDSRKMAAAFGRREWELYSIFLLGRNDFELGRYKLAEERFINGLLLCRLYFDAEKQKVFYTWIARCRIYAGQRSSALNILGGLKPDTEVFFITSEALFFMGRRERALDALQLAMDWEFANPTLFNPGEYISWRSGFSSVEDRALRTREGTGVLFHLIRVFRGYIWGKGAEKEEGRQELSRITRDERLGEEDPFNHFYYYLYNEIVPELGDAEIVNKLTILSRSLKYLQQRASRIDNTDDKKDYLYKNHWNAIIMKEGREQKIL